ncbi:MAG: type II secretion system F family protein [Candidatus Omnitrophota bacterium]
MKIFQYRAKNSRAEWVTGIVEAHTQDDAVGKISAQGLVPVEVEELRAGKASKSRGERRKRSFQITGIIITFFYRQMARMTRSGLQLLSALSVLAEEMDVADFKQLLQTVEQKVRQGSSLSQALGEHPRFFSSFEISMIQAGESIGNISDALQRIADYRVQQEQLVKKIKSASVYPAFVLGLGGLSVVFILTFVIPKFAGFFNDLGQELPLLTRGLIAISSFFSHYGILLAAGLIMLGFAIGPLLRKPKVKAFFDRWVLGLPRYGKIIFMVQVGRFCQTLALLLSSGIPLVQAVRISVPALTNTVLRGEFEGVSGALEKGEPMSQILKRSKRFSGIMPQLIRMGEESGRLDSVLRELGEWYEFESVTMIGDLLQLLEPLLILLVGLLVGAILIAVLLPVFSMNALIL